ncbi:hypothetical protein I2I11_17910 [Pontibacter sp. 172403-2]|uniref:hypothetical protein n=1 Tax=Pontibacter rufus TaxID=2791028 RepID=UPI0018AF9D1B|nr:hypothetical protein [Pontibacter sp. 172403-2]MBF9255178.1 hypothetical protein [Pontibacter sp. 172403-2]
MKINIDYLNDQNGNPKAVQLSIAEWQRLQKKLLYYEQKLKIRSDLAEAFDDVAHMQQGKKPKQSLTEFLNEL